MFNLRIDIHIMESCKNRVYADQSNMTVSRAQVPTNRCREFFEVFG